MTRTRLGAALLTGVLALVTVGLPGAVAAGPVTRFVDDDGRASAAGCDTSTPAYSTIQSAVTAAHASDTVAVCPGSYQEQILINANKHGLVLRAIELYTARILSPAVLGNDGVLIDIRAQGVIVKGFKIASYAMSSGCQKVFAAVLVEPGASAVIRGNRIYPIGDDTFGSCGYMFGVFVGSDVATAGSDPIAKANVVWNVIKDFQAGGVVAVGLAKARVDQDSIQYLHGQPSPFGDKQPPPKSMSPAGCSTSTIQERGARFSRAIRAARSGIGPAGRPQFEAIGIGYLFGAYGVANRNHVYSGVPGQCSATLLAGFLAGVPELSTASDPIAPFGHIRWDGNLSLISLANYWIAGTTNVTATDNVGSFGEVGLYLQNAAGVSIARHKDDEAANGIRVDSENQDNVITDGDFRGNASEDCLDESTGTGTGTTANTWTNDLGDDSSPAGICNPAP